MKLPALLRFDRAQSAYNSFYYTRGGGYEKDFSTYASRGNEPAFSEAEEFCSGKSPRAGRLGVLEIGCGNGNNARRFLQRVSELDEKNGTEIARRLDYALADFSREMLADALKNARKSGHPGKIFTVVSDAQKLRLEEKFLLARSNEVFDDLPARMVSFSRGKTDEAWLRIFCLEPLEFEVVRRPAEIGAEETGLAKESLPGIPDGALVPVPCGAANCMKSVHGLLEEGGVFDVFDYGFNSEKELLSLQHSVFRAPGALTAFVNFPFLVLAARRIGYRKASIEPQRDFTGGKEDGRFYHLRLVK